MNQNKARVVAMALGVAAAGMLRCAGQASATSVIGAGNAAHDNNCTNKGARGEGANSSYSEGGGLLGGLAVALPASGPANQCGNLGLPSELLNLEGRTSPTTFFLGKHNIQVTNHHQGTDTSEADVEEG
ncbi:hypothetical protein [Streptomyces sp. NPDC047014]|uniref:hypothetical protein n=1 Tax=Streptomyces sp. NPDC047014 TaxID=3155736 RepID=UPI0033DA077D